MTTRITVTTGDGGLLERNAQQQAAARQAALVKAQAEQAAATGAEQQRQRRIASGLDPATGRPLPSAGSTSRLTRIDQEPAAFRRGGGAWSYYFPTEPVYSVFEGTTTNTYRTSGFIRKARKPLSSEFAFRTDTSFGSPRTNPALYLPNGGPSGESCLRLQDRFVWGVGIGGTVSTEFNTVGPLKPGPVAFTIETDVKVSRPAPDWGFNIAGGSNIYTFEPTRVLQYGIGFSLQGLSLPNLFQVAIFGLGETVIEIAKPSNWLAEWSRIALVCNDQTATLFVKGEQIAQLAYSSPSEPIPDGARADAAVSGEIGDNQTANAYCDCPGLVWTPSALFSSTYTPSPLRY